VAALAFVLCVIAIEVFARGHVEWFADLAAWQWQSKSDAIESGALEGDIAIFGTSVLFHGLDTTSAVSRDGARIVNLALNGMEWQHEAQLLRDRVNAPHPPRLAVVEFRQAAVEHDSWIRGPYFRFWATPGEFMESRFYYWDLPLSFTFLANRALVTFRYREAIDNWLFEALRERRIPDATRDRNRATAAAIRTRAGMSPAFDEDHLRAYVGPPRERTWAVNVAGELWMRRFLDLAASRGMQVVLLLPPSPPYLTERPGPNGFRARFDAEVAALRRDYPSLGLDVFEPKGFALEDFADEIHLNLSGRSKMSAQFAQWIADYRPPVRTDLRAAAR